MSEDETTRTIIRKAVDRIFDAALQPLQKTDTSIAKSETQEQPSHTDKVEALFKSFKLDETKDAIEPKDIGTDPLSRAVREKKREGKL